MKARPTKRQVQAYVYDTAEAESNAQQSELDAQLEPYLGSYEVQADDVIDAVRAALKLKAHEGQIIHYWWRDMDCLTVFNTVNKRHENKTYFMTVTQTYPHEFTVKVERIHKQ